MQNCLIKATLEQARQKLDAAINGLGDMNENSLYGVQLGWFTPQEIATARQETGGWCGQIWRGYSRFSGMAQAKPASDTVMNDRAMA